MYSFIAPNHNLVINSTAPLVNDKIIPFQLYLGPGSVVTNLKFRSKNQNSYPGSTVVQFVDSGTTPVTVANLQQAYNLVYNFTDNTLYDNRFYLIITAPAKAKVKSCTEYNTLEVNNPSTHPVSYTVTQSSTGTVISNATNFTGIADIPNLSEGDYLVSFTNEIGMISSQTVHIDSVSFSASIALNDTMIDISMATLPFSANTVSSSTGVTYLWNFGDNTTSTSANPNHAYTALGNYEVTLKATSAQGCISYDTMYVEVVDYTVLEHVKKAPASFLVLDKTVQFKGDELPSLFTVYSLDGKLIESLQITQRTAVLSSLSPGVYIAKAQYKNSIVTRKLFVK
jgi:PKD repeat protein